MYIRKHSNLPMGRTDRKDYMRSPTSGRPILVGGRVWLNLVKEGIIANDYVDEKDLGPAPVDPIEFAKKVKEINKTLPIGTHAVRGRGKYDGKLVRRNKQPNVRDVQEYTSKLASRIVKRKIEKMKEESEKAKAKKAGKEVETETITDDLDKLILKEMMKETRPMQRRILPIRKPKPVPKYRVKKPVQTETETETETEQGEQTEYDQTETEQEYDQTEVDETEQECELETIEECEEAAEEESSEDEF